VPWRDTKVTDERMRFLVAHQRGEDTMAALCNQYGISRTTGYTLLARFAAEGVGGLVDRSRAPHRQGRQTPAPVEEAIVAFKEAHPRRGPRKIKVALSQQHPETVGTASPPHAEEHPSPLSVLPSSHTSVHQSARGVP